MKLIYLASIGLPTGWAHSIQIIKMCEAFAMLGHEVTLVVPRRPNKIKTDPFTYYDVKRSFAIKKLPCLDLMPGSPSRFVFWTRLISFFISSKIYLLFKKHDILYSREQLSGLFFKDINLEIHELPEIIKPLHKKIWQRAKSLVVLTNFIKAKLIENNIAENKIIIVSDGVDIIEFDLATSQTEARMITNLPLDKKIILYAGSFYLHNWKGVDILLEAAKYLSDYYFVLVGGEVEEIKKIQQRYQLKNLILITHQSYRQVPYYLKAADILVLPNKKGDKNSEFYTSPMKLFEYMASRRPIVASDLPSVREILSEQNAILVRPSDPASLVGGIKKILSDKTFAEKISQEAFRRAQNYSWNRRAENILRFLKQNETKNAR